MVMAYYHQLSPMEKHIQFLFNGLDKVENNPSYLSDYTFIIWINMDYSPFYAKSRSRLNAK